MKAIVYSSRMLATFKPEDFAELCRFCEYRNKVSNITGYLCCYKNSFVQYIEGDDASVSALMERIEMDSRHTVLRRYEDKHLNSPRFPHWSMKPLDSDVAICASLESIIQQHFYFIENAVGDEERWLELIWHSIDRVAHLHQQKVL